MDNNNEEENHKTDSEETDGSANRIPSKANIFSKQELEELEAQIIKYEKPDSKRPRTSNKLPGHAGPSYEKDNVGDDVNKKSEQDILCECHPNVTGAAIPQMISFESIASTSKRVSDVKVEVEEEDSANDVIKSHASTNLIPSFDVVASMSRESLGGSSGSNNIVKSSMEEDSVDAKNIDKLHKDHATKSKVSQNVKNQLNKKPSKRPSLIPKFSRANSSTKPVRDCGKIDLLVTTNKSNQPNPSKKSIDFAGKKRVISEDTKPTSAGPSKISSRMMGLQERLKATTSMLRRKFEDDKKKESKSVKRISDEILARQGLMTSTNVSERSVTNILDDLLSNISQMKQAASRIETNSPQKTQKEYVEKLFMKISEIQKIADKLSELDRNPAVPENPQSGNKLPEMDQSSVVQESVKMDEPKLSQKATKKSPKKENKIYIKFMQTKDRSKETKRNVEDTQIDNTEGVQTDLALGSKLTSESLNSQIEETKTQKEIPLKESDSMDGVFIPSCEPPMNTEEEEETNGLDITITFPEFTSTLSNRPDSHLSVRLSDISAEALRQLKRCPKDFTLRMDFVQGKVLFQSGKSAVNNFSIGPDLKFIENVVDNKKSDIISIKPSTECSFASQLISVENVNKELGSGRSLRAIDSEIFSVVNMPFIYRNPSSVTKSCVTFKNDGIFSMAILAGQFVRSMPQIPRLTNIFDDGFIENVNKAAGR
nr:muscle M-line assembly protein unc-89-like [Leptinotarsa decemlineata]